MKRLALISILCLVLHTLVFGTSPRSFIQVLKYENGSISDAVTNGPKSTAFGYTATADIISTPGEVLSTATSRYTQIRIYSVGNEKASYTMLFVQLGWFSTQWQPGDTLRVTITLDATGESVSKDYVLPQGDGVLQFLTPELIIPAYAYKLTGKITGPDLSNISIVCPNAIGIQKVNPDSTGAFSFLVRYGDNPIVKPNKSGWKFSPAQHNYTGIKSDIYDADFSMIK